MKRINFNLLETKFLVTLDHQQIGIIIDALIDKAGEEKCDPYAKQILMLADEIQKNFAASLEETSRPYSARQIKKRLEAFED